MARGITVAGTALIGGVPVPLDTALGGSFMADCARFTEGLIDEHELRAEWGLSEAEWIGIGENGDLLEAVRRLMRKRVESGTAAQERARYAYPDVVKGLVEIANSKETSPRHRIEASRELRAVSNISKEGGAGSPGQFIITINMGADTPPLHVVGEVPPRDEEHDGAEPSPMRPIPGRAPAAIINGHGLASVLDEMASTDD